MINLPLDITPTDTTQKYRCPRHICLTCLYTEEQLYKSNSLLTCVRCLSSYHNKHGCLPSGCELLTNQSMICYMHCSKPIAASVLNINWCFECGTAGVLICCEVSHIFTPLRYTAMYIYSRYYCTMDNQR